MRPSPADAWRTSVADESGVGRARWPGPPRRAKLAASVVLDLSEGDNEETAGTRSSYESSSYTLSLFSPCFTQGSNLRRAALAAQGACRLERSKPGVSKQG